MSSESERETTELGSRLNDESNQPNLSSALVDSPRDVDNSPAGEVGSEVATSTEESNKSPEEAVPEGEDHASSQINENIQGTIEHEVLQTRQPAVNGHDTTNLSQDKSEETHEHTNGSINHTPVSESHELDLENDAQPPFLDDDLKLSLGGEDALGASEVINEHSTAPPEEDGEGEDVPARDQEISADVLRGENTEQLVIQRNSTENHRGNGSGEFDPVGEDLKENEEAPGLTRELSAPEDDDAFNGRPDPESQGYSLIRDEEDQIHDQWESEGANTSADVQDAENGDDEPEPESLSLAFSQEGGSSSNPFAAFAQIQGSNSGSSVALEFVAHQIVDPSNPVPQDMEPQLSGEEEQQTESLGNPDIWGSIGNHELFDFESGSKNPGEFDDEFDPTSKVSQESLKHPNSSTDDPFAEVSNDLDNLLKEEVEQAKTTDLFGDDNFDELFPSSQQKESSISEAGDFLSSAAPAVSSLFSEPPQGSELFNGTDDFLVSTAEAKAVEPQVSHDAQPIVNSDAAPALQMIGEDDLLDDLDDSEFMAAFGVSSEVKAQPAASTAPSIPSVPFQQNRYLPPAPQPVSQNQYTPQSAPLTQPTSNVPQVPNQPAASRTISSRYAPSTTAPTSASINPQQPLHSPHIQPTYPGRPQVAVSSPPSTATRPALETTSSFVTAKGGYSSPYDLPPQIAPKPKRHLPPPIPTYQRAGVPTAPLSANLYPTPPPPGPPPRSASTQPHFPAHNFPSSTPQSPGHNVYIPPNVASSQNLASQYQGQEVSMPPRAISPLVPHPPRSTQSQQSKAYAPPSTASPPNTRMPGARQRQPSLPGRVLSPPTQMSSLPPQFQGGVGYQQPARITSPTMQVPPSANRYTPEPGATPQRTVQYQQQARVASPPIQAPPTNRYTPELGGAPQRGVHVQPQNLPPAPQRGQVRSPPMQAPPPNRYTPEPGMAPQRGVSMQPQQPQQPTHASWQQPHSDHRVSQMSGPQILSTPFHDHALDNIHDIHSEGMHPPSNSTTFSPPTSQITPSQYQHISQLQQFPNIQDNTYQTPFNTLEENVHADLPPHFEMMEEADSFYRPEGIIPDRHMQKTPEPNHPIQPDDVSPPRPWERAALAGQQQNRSPSKLPSFSQYDSAPVPLAQARAERQRSISPAAVRATPRSSMDLPFDRSQSYPSRKPPPHLRDASSSGASMTPEEDYQLRRGGCPIVSFGFGGKLITMIPRTPHRVNIRNTAPLMVPGPITFTKLRDIVDPPGLASSFPGPLFSGTKPINAKSKDLGNWLESNLAMLDQMRESHTVTEDDIIWIEDRKVLMKLIKVLVENNGVLHGTPEIDKKVKDILLPQAASLSSGDDSESFGVTASSLALSSMTPSSADPTALATYNLTTDFLRSIRSLLMQGDRPGAIRKAVDQKMWGHALLIASSVSEIAWRETAEQFIQSELRGPGSQEFDSLRFLYGVFGGEGINAINELLPPTNRMISSIQPSASSSIPKFNSWKESLGMALLNRGSMADHSAPLGLGDSLVSNGRIDAGHACFLLTMPTARFSAADLLDTNFTLLGADQQTSRANYVGIPQILLSEILEYTQCQSKQTPSGSLHLLPYKLWYAWTLADYGYPEIAEKYCESIGAFLQKESRGSIFITSVLIEVLKDLTERISQGSKSSFSEKTWFGKKTARGDNFWKALETNLTKFVAGGEEVDESSSGLEPATQPEAQDPRFGRIASETSINRMLSMPNLRNQATTPVYGTFPQEVPRPPGTHSRYITGGSESRYNPAARYEQVSDFPGRGISTPDLDLGESSSYQPYSPPSEYQPYVPPPEPVKPSERTESPKIDDEPVRERQESGKSDKSSAEKDKEKKESAENKGSGWFGGWFKRGATEPAPAVPGKPIKAKLGEESSFYYDKDLKKWVNKKDGNAPAKTAPPPPPPKRPSNLTSINSTPAPTPEIASPTMMPPPRTPITQTPAPMPTTPSSRSEPALQPTDLPPSRPTSVLQSKPATQKLDPLEALLSTRPASGARGARKPARSKYVDVMNKK